MYRIQKHITLLFLILLSAFTSAELMAQDQTPPQKPATEVSNEELGQFANALLKVQVVDQEMQQKMVEVVEKQGLGVERYTEIQQSHQSQSVDESISPEELRKFEAATEEFVKIQTNAQESMQGAIVKEGLTVERYQQIAVALQQDQELQKRVQAYFQ